MNRIILTYQYVCAHCKKRNEVDEEEIEDEPETYITCTKCGRLTMPYTKIYEEIEG